MGPSSALNVVGAVKLARTLPEGQSVGSCLAPAPHCRVRSARRFDRGDGDCRQRRAVPHQAVVQNVAGRQGSGLQGHRHRGRLRVVTMKHSMTGIDKSGTVIAQHERPVTTTRSNHHTKRSNHITTHPTASCLRSSNSCLEMPPPCQRRQHVRDADVQDAAFSHCIFSSILVMVPSWLTCEQCKHCETGAKGEGRSQGRAHIQLVGQDLDHVLDGLGLRLARQDVGPLLLHRSRHLLLAEVGVLLANRVLIPATNTSRQHGAASESIMKVRDSHVPHTS